MKTKSLLIVSLILFLTSCKSHNFYQVYQTEATQANLKITKDYLVYEDDNCIVSYNLWSDGGNMGFKIYNKTDENLYLNLTESFFIFNGIAHDYYMNRLFSSLGSTKMTTSPALGVSELLTGSANSEFNQPKKEQVTNDNDLTPKTENSVSSIENRIVIIPSKAAKIIAEYHINEALYRDCDLYKYPSEKEINSIEFSKADSPFVFSNRIAYSVGQTGSLTRFENEFYVTEITNYPESEITTTEREEFCGQQGMKNVTQFDEIFPDGFYLFYNKGEKDNWKH